MDSKQIQVLTDFPETLSNSPHMKPGHIFQVTAMEAIFQHHTNTAPTLVCPNTDTGAKGNKEESTRQAGSLQPAAGSPLAVRM
jgi:hypothetical protein